MAPPIPSELFQPQWFFPFFICLWLGISALISLIGGWHSLAGEFPAVDSVEGERSRFASGSLGRWPFPVSSYGGCLFLTIGDHGFRLSIFFPFRFLSPPLFIPWSEVESVESGRFLFVLYTLVRLHRGWPVLSLRGRAARYMLEKYQGVSRAP